MAPLVFTSPALQPTDREADRIEALDVLRGIALLGMFLVHFNDNASPAAAGAGAVYQRIVGLFFEERFWTMFGILFGAGFAVQLRRAQARSAGFTARYLRRVAALAGFGLIAHAVFGFNVLLGYAMWALPLLLIGRWPLKALMVALAISAASWSLYFIAHASYGVATSGEAAYIAEREAVAERNRTFNQANHQEQHNRHYPTVFRARLRHMRWFYAQPFSFLPVNTLTLFLIGLIGVRLGLFDEPETHQRLILGFMVFGVSSWVAENWLMSAEGLPSGPLVLSIAIGRLETGLGLVRAMWLAFAYIGAVLLVAARRPAWLRSLAPFRWTGRMALTNYMAQIAILDLAFSNYALHLALTPLQGLGAGLALFGGCAVFSRWWLSRFLFGPLEWVWRSATYGARQPWRATSSPDLV